MWRLQGQTCTHKLGTQPRNGRLNEAAVHLLEAAAGSGTLATTGSTLSNRRRRRSISATRIILGCRTRPLGWGSATYRERLKDSGLCIP